MNPRDSLAEREVAWGLQVRVGWLLQVSQQSARPVECTLHTAYREVAEGSCQWPRAWPPGSEEQENGRHSAAAEKPEPEAGEEGIANPLIVNPTCLLNALEGTAVTPAAAAA